MYLIILNAILGYFPCFVFQLYHIVWHISLHKQSYTLNLNILVGAGVGGAVVGGAASKIN